MNRQSNKKLVFETGAELDAFMKGYRLGVSEECDEIDCASCASNGVWSVELLKVYDEDANEK